MPKHYRDLRNDLYQRVWGHSYDKHRELLGLTPIKGEHMPPRKKKVCRQPTPPEANPYRIDWGFAEAQLTATTVAEARTMVREQAVTEPVAYFAETEHGIQAIPEPQQEQRRPTWTNAGYRLNIAPPIDLAPICKQPNDPTPKGDFEMDA